MCNLTLYYSSAAGEGASERGSERRLETDDGVHESRKVIGEGRERGSGRKRESGRAERTDNNFGNIAAAAAAI